MTTSHNRLAIQKHQNFSCQRPMTRTFCKVQPLVISYTFLAVWTMFWIFSNIEKNNNNNKKGWTTSNHSPVLWNPRWALSRWWCNIKGPAKHHTTDPATKDQAEATQLPDRVARLFLQSTRDSILARHECRNHWLHPEMQRLYVTSE